MVVALAPDDRRLLTMPTDYAMEVYDPREGQRYVYKLGRGVSFDSLVESFFVVDSWPDTWRKMRRRAALQRLDDAHSAFLKIAIARTSVCGFVCCDPCDQMVMERMRPIAESVHCREASCLAYMDVAELAISHILAIRNELQTYEEWIIGGCCTPLGPADKPAPGSRLQRSFNLEFVLAHAAQLGCFCYRNGEHGESILMTKVFEGIDAAIHRCFGELLQ